MTKREANRTKWVSIVAKYRQSGLSKPEFAGRHGLNLKHLQNWAYRLPEPGRAVPKRKARRTQVRMVPVRVAAAAPTPTLAGVQVLVDIRTLQMAVPADADPTRVGALVKAMREATC